MPKVRYSACGTQRARRKPETTKSLQPSRLGYYQNLVVWNKVGPVQVSPVAQSASCEFFFSISIPMLRCKLSGVQPSQAALPLASLISKPTGLSNAKLAQVLKWEPDQLGAIRVQSQIVYFAIQTLIASSRLLSMTQPRPIYFNQSR